MNDTDVEGKTSPNEGMNRRQFLRDGSIVTASVAAGLFLEEAVGGSTLSAQEHSETTEDFAQEHVNGAEQHEAKHHNTPLTDLFSVAGLNSLGVALKNGLVNGHFTGQDWASVVSNLGGFLTALGVEEGAEKVSHEVMAVGRDLIILNAIIIGGAFGDKLLTTKDELGLPQTIAIPDGIVVKEEDMTQILNSMSKLILENAPVNIASTGAAAIIFDTNLRAVTERLIFKPSLAKGNQLLNRVSSEIASLEEITETSGDSINLIFQESKGVQSRLDEILTSISSLSGKTGRSSDIQKTFQAFSEIEGDMFDSIEKLLTEIDIKLINGITRTEKDKLEGLRGSLSSLSEEYILFKNEILDQQKWDAMGSYYQSFRAVANIIGKAILFAGDPPNAVLAVKMAVGDLDMSVPELLEMQIQGLFKNWDSLTEAIISSEKEMMLAFGFEPKNLNATKNVMGQVKSTLIDQLPGQFNKFVNFVRKQKEGDIEGAALELNGLEDTKENRNLVAATLKNMKNGAVEMAHELARMKSPKSVEIFGEKKNGINQDLLLQTLFDNEGISLKTKGKDLRDIAINSFREAFTNNENHGEHSRVSMYRLINALSISNQEDVELVLNQVIEHNTDHVDTLIKIMKSFTTNGELSTTEQDSIEEDLLSIFKDFDAAENLLIKLGVVRELEANTGFASRLIRRSTEPSLDVRKSVEKFDFTYSNSMMIQEIFPTVHHSFGHGTQEIASLVTLQFLAGPMVAHSFMKFIVQPEIDHQVAEFGKVVNIDPIIQRILLMGATSPLSDNGLVVNVGSTILQNLFDQGVIDHPQFIAGMNRLFNAAIEAGDGLPTGGPASAPFKDEPFNATTSGWQLTWSNFFANVPIAGEPTQADILKNIVYYRGLKQISRLVPNIQIPESITAGAGNLAKGVANIAINALEYINPSIITRPLVGRIREKGDKNRDEIVFAAINKLRNAMGNIQSQEF